MRTDLVTTPSGRQYSVVDWLNGRNSGPFDELFNRIHMTLTLLSGMTTECEISDEFYNYILDTFCDVYYSHIGYSRNVSDLTVVIMKLSTSTTASDEALRMIRWECFDLQVQGHGPNDFPWAYTETEKQKTQTRLQGRPNAEWWWQRKAELVCREGFQSRIRSNGLHGGAARWSGTAINELMERVAVEECHLKTYLRSVPLAQAVALLSNFSNAGELEVPALSDKQYLILQTMMEMKARSADTRITAGKIATACDGKQADVNVFKPLLSDLTKNHTLTESKIGRDGGSWLTEKGVEVANRVLQNGKSNVLKR